MLGQGAFGVVRKAVAKGIGGGGGGRGSSSGERRGGGSRGGGADVEALLEEDDEVVAVKMVKTKFDLLQIKALLSELKVRLVVVFSRRAFFLSFRVSSDCQIP